MCPDDLQSFIKHLEETDDLTRVKVPVDPYLEIAAIIDRVSKGANQRRALIFEQVKGSDLPLAANLYGSLKRMAQVFGVDNVDIVAARLEAALAATGAVNGLEALAQVVEPSQRQAKKVSDASCYDVDCSAEGLNVLPLLQSWPGDAGPYLTLGQIFTCHPEDGATNCGMYRVQALDRSTALLRCHPGSGGGDHLAAWHLRGEAMPVAIALGGPPVLTWAAGVTLPEGVSEVAFAGYLSGNPLTMTACQTSELMVPATAEIVIEGRIHPGEVQPEGPFGNHTGSYAVATPAPLLRIEHVSMREHAIYPCTVVGPPPMENVYLAAATERLLLPVVQYDYPWVHNLHMPLEGIFHRATLVAIGPTELSAKEISHALRQTALLRTARLLILLDTDMELCQFAQVYWRVVNIADWTKHIIITEKCMVVDARRSSDAETVGPDPITLQKIMSKWSNYGLS